MSSSKSPCRYLWLLVPVFFVHVAVPWAVPGQTVSERPFVLFPIHDGEDKGDIEQCEAFKRAIEDGKFHNIQPPILEYLNVHPRSWRAYYLLGYALFRDNSTLDSVVALKKALELKPDHPEAHKLLGLNYVLLDRLELGEAEMLKAAEILPESPEIRYYIGRIYYLRGTYPLAQKEFEKTIELDRGYLRAYDNLGLTHQAMGNDEAAVENFRKAIKICKEKGLQREWPYINLATIYNRLNDPKQALQNAEMAVRINVRADQAYFQMAKAYHSMSDWDKSVEALQKAIEIKPNSFEYHYTLSQIYRKNGKIKESGREIEICMKLQSSPGSTAEGNQTSETPLPPTQ